MHHRSVTGNETSLKITKCRTNRNYHRIAKNPLNPAFKIFSHKTQLHRDLLLRNDCMWLSVLVSHKLRFLIPFLYVICLIMPSDNNIKKERQVLVSYTHSSLTLHRPGCSFACPAEVVECCTAFQAATTCPDCMTEQLKACRMWVR